MGFLITLMREAKVSHIRNETWRKCNSKELKKNMNTEKEKRKKEAKKEVWESV